MRLTDAQLWELRALAGKVENAELRLAIARAAHQERANQYVAALGLDPSLPHVIHEDGTITPTQEQS